MMTGLLFTLFLATAIVVTLVLADSAMRGAAIAKTLRQPTMGATGMVTVTRIDQADDIALPRPANMRAPTRKPAAACRSAARLAVAA